MTSSSTPLSILSTPADEAARNARVHELFHEWATRTPHAPAVIDGERRWSYAELDRLADETAAAMAEQVHPGDLVGVCLDRSAALAVVALAVARLGAVYLPFGPEAGEQRLLGVAGSLRLRCLVGTPERLPQACRPEQLPLPVPGTNVVAAVLTPGATSVGAPTGTYYTVLTSGSTGEPKAVAVGEESLAALLHWYRRESGMGPGDRHSFLMGVAFDAHVMEMWATLTSGAALSVSPQDVRWDTHALTDWWRSAGITVGFLPTPLAEPVLDRPWPTGLPLRHLGIGGDRLRRWPGADVTARVYNAYGPAEATVVTSTYPLTAGGAEAAGDPPIGLPLPGATVLVTDENGRPVPRGVSGELRIGGRLLALGYFDEELTGLRFVPGPSSEPGTGRVYRTGDRVVMRPDGVLEFLGRIDDQVKVGGVRTELAEVERALEREPRVRRAVVALRRDPSGTAFLVAFVETAPGTEAPDPAELRDHARAWLPEQACPVAYEFVEDFPLNPNGKIDRAALLTRWEARPAEVTEDLYTGLSPAEATVLRLCREILGDSGILLNDNFLNSGGNSLRGALLITALEQECGIRLRAHELLQQPDLRSMATLVGVRATAAVSTRS
ncbi:non-ribosomal peptide synthetase [Streptomyces sp. NPDC059255]|uniref:non-ribosomal peptide synthetase n=1 Tax=Streptomyces sp. NPDC059255 TaxID=3346793 RepID=UPI0036D1B418